MSETNELRQKVLVLDGFDLVKLLTKLDLGLPEDTKFIVFDNNIQNIFNCALLVESKEFEALPRYASPLRTFIRLQDLPIIKENQMLEKHGEIREDSTPREVECFKRPKAKESYDFKDKLENHVSKRLSDKIEELLENGKT